VDSQASKITEPASKELKSLSLNIVATKEATNVDQQELQKALIQYQKVMMAGKEQLASKKDVAKCCYNAFQSLGKKLKLLTLSFEKHQYLAKEGKILCNQLKEYGQGAAIFAKNYNRELTPEDYQALAGLDTTEEIEKNK